MAWILNALHSAQDAFNSSTPAPTASRELALPKLKKLNDSVYELCKPSGSQLSRPSVEIVFFHGLQFDGSEKTYVTTWLSKDLHESWLPWIFQCFPDARILLISYNGCAQKKDAEGGPDMYITSENLWQDLIDDNAHVGQDGCPVVLVGHSLGGLVMKEVLLTANSVLSLDPPEKVKENLGYLLQNVKHLFYYSCPHNGTRLADIETKFVKGQLFAHLTTFNEEAARCNEKFRKLRHKSKWKAFSIVETLPTDLGQLGRHIVVEEASARYDTDDYYTAQVDHVNVCRPLSTTDASFSKLKDVINQALAADVKGHKVRVSRHEVVGLDDQVKMVRDKLENSRQVGLFGPGGIGKTTLAKIVYNDMSDNFEYTCFVSGVKGSVTRKGSLEDLQEEILKNMYYKGRQIFEKGREANFEWSRLEGKIVLIVLDDVNYESQILVLTESNGFSTESCVLLTSRDKKLLTSKDFNVHHVEFLDDEPSRRLFCIHAFKIANAPQAYEDRVEKFTQKCKGWPLVLEVAGKYLYKQEEGRVWDDAFEKLSQAKPLNGKIDEDEIWPIFTVIYHSLATEEQQMFLDIAICFHDEELESVKRAWRVCRAFADAAWQNLLDIGLVTVTEDLHWENLASTNGITKIHMHEVLRDLGSSIACPDPTNIQDQSHVCYDMGTSPSPFEQRNPGVEILKIVSNAAEHYPDDDPRCTIIDIGKLRGLENLKALWLVGVSLRGACNLFPAKLAFLKLKAGEMSDASIPFPYDNDDDDNDDEYDSGSPCCSGREVVCGVAVQPFKAISRKEKDWSPKLRAAVSQPNSTLRHLEFERGRDLGPLIDTFGQLKVLEYLSFEQCCSRDLPQSFKQHGALKHLRIEFYQDIALPDSLGDLQALEHLEIGDSVLKGLPSSLGQFRALKSLAIGGYRAETIPDSLGQLSALESLTLRSCYRLRALPSTLGQLKALRRLDIERCRKLAALPETLGQLDGLRNLRITYCQHLKSLPDALMKLQSLSHLEITQCPYLNALPPAIMELRGLRHIEIDGLHSLESLQDILGKLPPLQLQYLSVCSSEDPRTVKDTLGQVDAVKHLNIWIGKTRLDKVGKEELRSREYFEILPHWYEL